MGTQRPTIIPGANAPGKETVWQRGKPLPLCPLRHGKSSLYDLCLHGPPSGTFTPTYVLSTPVELPYSEFQIPGATTWEAAM